MPYCSSDEGNKGYCWELDAPLDTNLGPLVMQSSLHIHIVYYYSLNFCLSLYSLVTVSCICSLNLWQSSHSILYLQSQCIEVLSKYPVFVVSICSSPVTVSCISSLNLQKSCHSILYLQSQYIEVLSQYPAFVVSIYSSPVTVSCICSLNLQQSSHSILYLQS